MFYACASAIFFFFLSYVSWVEFFLCMLQHVLSGPTCPTCGNIGNRPKSPQDLPRLQTALNIIRESFKGTCALGYNYINGSLHTPSPPPKKKKEKKKRKSPIVLFCAISIPHMSIYLQTMFLYCVKSYNGKQVNSLSK